MISVIIISVAVLLTISIPLPVLSGYVVFTVPRHPHLCHAGQVLPWTVYHWICDDTEWLGQVFTEIWMNQEFHDLLYAVYSSHGIVLVNEIRVTSLAVLPVCTCCLLTSLGFHWPVLYNVMYTTVWLTVSLGGELRTETVNLGSKNDNSSSTVLGT